MNITISPINFEAGIKKTCVRKAKKILVPVAEYKGPFLSLTNEDQLLINSLLEKRSKLAYNDRKNFNMINEEIRKIKINRVKQQKQTLQNCQ